MRKALKWTARKLLALVLAALVVAVGFALTDRLGSNTFFETVLGVWFFAAYLGGLPALLATGLADLVSRNLEKWRWTVALCIHLLGGFLVMFALLGWRLQIQASDLPFVGLSLGAALVFFLVDEWIKARKLL